MKLKADKPLRKKVQLAQSREKSTQKERRRHLKKSKSNFNRTPILFKPPRKFCRSIATANASSTKKDLPVIAAEAAKLKAENGKLEQQLEVSRRDQSDVFTLYQKTEQLNRQLKGDADTLRTLREHAPDKLKEALTTAEQRKTAKRSSPFKGSESNRGGK